MIRHLLGLLVLFVCLADVIPAFAFETDQFNLPPQPLADIAPDVETYVTSQIQEALDDLNEQIDLHEWCSTGLPMVDAPRRRDKCASRTKELAILERLHSPEAVTEAVYKQLGTGSIFQTNTTKWLDKHKFEHEPARYKPDYRDSIYWTYPINYATLSPTIRMYGVEFGTDKLDHFFQQGYVYYTKYRKELSRGRTDAEALKKVVSWGRSTENLWFGYLVSGVYSNADLAANFSGMRFYQALTNDVQLGELKFPAILTIADGHWQFSVAHMSEVSRAVNTGDGLLRKFLSDHLNEALNPSNYLFLLYPIVKKMVRTHDCPGWRATYPAATRDQLTARSAALQTWHGLDYGYKQTNRQPKIGDLCFAGNARDSE